MPNSIVKLLGDSVYSLESQDTTEFQRGGLGKLSYGLRTEAIVEQQRGGLGKISYQGANRLAKLSMYGDDDTLTFNQHQLMPSMNFAAAAPQPPPSRARRPPQRRPKRAAPPRRTAPPPRRTAPPPRRPAPPPKKTVRPPPRAKPTKATPRRPAPKRTAPPRRRVPRHPPKNYIYPPDTTPYRKFTGSAMQAPTNRGVVKTSQIETGLPRTKARQGQVATTTKQVERASEGTAPPAPRKRRALPIGWMNNIIKIFET